MADNKEQSTRINALLVQYFLEMNGAIKQIAEDNEKKNRLMAITVTLLATALFVVLIRIIILRLQ